MTTLSSIFILNFIILIFQGNKLIAQIVDPSVNIVLGSTVNPINPDLNGFQTAGLFKDLGTDSEVEGYVWPWIADLKPQVLRFPGGAETKFMHPFNATKGYGYNLEEIYKYFDLLGDNVITYSYSTVAALVSLDLENDASIDLFFNAVDALNHINATSGIEVEKDFLGYKDKFQKQNNASGRYIDDFVTLVNFLKFENPEVDVKVLYVANILTEGPEEVLAAIDYFESNLVTIGGIELGNECYADFFHDLFSATTLTEGFYDYWAFLNGNVLSNTFYNALVTNDVVDSENHNYIGFIKNQPINYKLGLVSAPICAAEFFFDSGENTDALDCYHTGWNNALATKLRAKINTPYGYRYRFDAIIVHPYFGTDSWTDFTESYFDDAPSDKKIDDDILLLMQSGVYTFATPDFRLEGLFKDVLDESFSLVSNHYDGNLFGEQFIKYLDAYNNFTNIFGDSFFKGSAGKKLWTTEWNLKDHNNNSDADNGFYLYNQVFDNTFLHGYLIFEWVLQQYEAQFELGAYDPLADDGDGAYEFTDEFNDQFYEFSNFHNLAGEAITNIISREKTKFGDYNSPFESNVDLPNNKNYIKRTPYGAYLMLNEISSKNLQLVDAGITRNMDEQLLNVHVYFSESESTLYVYYSNPRSETGLLKLNSLSITDFMDGGIVKICPIINTSYIATQLYSSAGQNYIYTIADDYATDGSDINFELEPVYPALIDVPCLNPLPAPWLEIVVPKYSFGVVKIGLDVIDLKEELQQFGMFSVFPNPANEVVNVFFGDINGSVNLVLSNAVGEIVLTEKISVTNNSQYAISTSAMAQGIYTLTVVNDGNVANKRIIIQR